MAALDPLTRQRLIEALRKHRVARYAARDIGVSTPCAWRTAKHEGITLISLAEHQRKRLADPEFRKKQQPAAQRAASAWLKEKHKDPVFHAKAVAAARRKPRGGAKASKKSPS
jgi:hypothetical protein